MVHGYNVEHFIRSSSLLTRAERLFSSRGGKQLLIRSESNDNFGAISHLSATTGHVTAPGLHERQNVGDSAAVDENEINKFSRIAANWWDYQGPMAPLHSMNPTRVKFIRQGLADHFRRDNFSSNPLHEVTLLDMGCGAGILSESLARLGATVTGVDASRDAIAVAKTHSQADPSLNRRLLYKVSTAEALVREGALFDAVIASEVIEHVPSPEAFTKSIAELVKPDGLVILSTINRTVRSYALAILAAERLLHLLPSGTHDWSKFLTPDELVLLMQSSGMALKDIVGMSLNPFNQKWSFSEDLAVNYIASFASNKPC